MAQLRLSRLSKLKRGASRGPFFLWLHLARFGSGTNEWNQTLALFKPLDGDPIQPSAAYLCAANLLRLCVLITTADGKIDLVELDVFRRAIENQPGLTLTDHKRLLILEQLLAQELCSASKTAARIAKSIPADKRLVIGKLLVEVAAASAREQAHFGRTLDDVIIGNQITIVCNEKACARGGVLCQCCGLAFLRQSYADAVEPLRSAGSGVT